MAMQSAAKCPFLLSFKTEPWDGPNENFKSHNTQLDDSTHLHTSSGKYVTSEKEVIGEKIGIERMRGNEVHKRTGTGTGTGRYHMIEDRETAKL